VALCGGRFKDWLRINPGGASAALAVAESRFAIGFGSRADAIEGMKPLGLTANGDGLFAQPTADSVASGSYPLGRLLYFYVLAPADGMPLRGELRTFLEYALSDEAQAAVEQAGFLRAPQSATETLSRLPASD
jgi:phosphate transport system substrate-binding protein